MLNRRTLFASILAALAWPVTALRAKRSSPLQREEIDWERWVGWISDDGQRLLAYRPGRFRSSGKAGPFEMLREAPGLGVPIHEYDFVFADGWVYHARGALRMKPGYLSIGSIDPIEKLIVLGPLESESRIVSNHIRVRYDEFMESRRIFNEWKMSRNKQHSWTDPVPN